MDKAKIHICLNMIKKLPVDDIDKNIQSFSILLNKKDQIKEFRNKVDKPLRISKDDSLGDFIKSEFNCELDSYRSPHSNKYFPYIDNAKYPPNELRQLEIILNKLFKEYAKLYYGNTAITSVYVWEHGENIESGFYCALLVKNIVKSTKGLVTGEWDSVNLVTIKFNNEKDERIKANYKIYSNVIFKFILDKVNVEISGSISRQVIYDSII
jgi:capping protein (actin filament) muscle Z-line, beta